jgi:hypothetical protein
MNICISFYDTLEMHIFMTVPVKQGRPCEVAEFFSDDGTEGNLGAGHSHRMPAQEGATIPKY